MVKQTTALGSSNARRTDVNGGNPEPTLARLHRLRERAYAAAIAEFTERIGVSPRDHLADSDLASVMGISHADSPTRLPNKCMPAVVVTAFGYATRVRAWALRNLKGMELDVISGDVRTCTFKDPLEEARLRTRLIAQEEVCVSVMSIAAIDVKDAGALVVEIERLLRNDTSIAIKNLHLVGMKATSRKPIRKAPIAARSKTIRKGPQNDIATSKRKPRSQPHRQAPVHAHSGRKRGSRRSRTDSDSKRKHGDRARKN